ncbi:MAG: hypothetical protein WEC84_02545 [Candidatus Andersenbacteria bacterium]
MTKRKIFLLVGGTAVIVSLVAIAFLLRTSPEPVDDSSSTPGNLPGGTSREAPFDQPTSEPQPTEAQPNTGITPALYTQVELIYTATPQFSISIDSAIATTEEVSTSQDYGWEGEDRYSTIRLVSKDEQTIHEERFVLPTSIVVEAFDETGLTFGGSVPVEESSALLILPTASNVTPARVVILDMQGNVVAEKDVVIPTEERQPQSFLNLHLWQPTLSKFIKSVFAQGADKKMRIVVISERGAESAIQPAMPPIQNMVNTDPWREFANQLEFIPVENSEPLGCRIIDLPGAPGLPACPNKRRVHQVVSKHVPNWDKIIVIHPVQNNFGSSDAPGTVTTWGSIVNTNIALHELAHLIGGLIDEYRGDAGVTEGPHQPNCFLSLQACEAAVTSHSGEGGLCSQGCGTVSQFRPANRIMYGRFNPPEYGPVERCVLRNALAKQLGKSQQPNCKDDTVPTPTGTPGTYWGWYR